MKTTAASKAKPYLDRMEETIGRYGLPGTMGRVIGWLMIADPACQTVDEVAQAVGADVGVITADLQALVAMNTIERVEVPGKNLACYALRPIPELLKRRVEMVRELHHVMNEQAQSLEQEDPAASKRLCDLGEVYGLVERALVEALNEGIGRTTP